MSKRFQNAASHPLQWPEHWPRTKNPAKSQFKTTLAKALDNVHDEIRLFGDNSGKKVTDIIISSNYSLSDRSPSDAGVCVYFTWDGEQTCIPVDRYKKVEENLQAISHCIAAERTKLRHGGINLVKAAFRGYAALPPAQKGSWRDMLGVGATGDLAVCKAAYKRLASKYHPDREGGSHTKMAEINQAWEDAQLELVHGRRS